MAHILDGDGLRTRAGWCCPRCSRCYGPRVDECRHCPDGETGKVPDEGPEPVVYTDKGPVPFSAFACGQVPPNKPATPAIFVPVRDVPGATPGRLADLQHVLNAAAIPFDGMVDGKFIPLPPGAKVVLPSHPGREWVKVPDVIAGGGHQYTRISKEWTEAWPGFQCRYGGSDSGPDFALINFRLTPADGSP